MLQCEKLFLISFLRYLKAMCSFDFWTASRYCCKQFRDGPNSKNLVMPDSSFSRVASAIVLIHLSDKSQEMIIIITQKLYSVLSPSNV